MPQLPSLPTIPWRQPHIAQAKHENDDHHLTSCALIMPPDTRTCTVSLWHVTPVPPTTTTTDDSSKRLATTLSKEADRLSQSQKQHQQPVLLVTTVDIGGGRSDRIEVRRGDDPSDVARAFCTRHGLPPAIVAPLTGHLEDNLRKAAAAAAASAAGAAVGAGAEKEPQAAAAAGAGSREPDLKPVSLGRARVGGCEDARNLLARHWTELAV